MYASPRALGLADLLLGSSRIAPCTFAWDFLTDPRLGKSVLT